MIHHIYIEFIFQVKKTVVLIKEHNQYNSFSMNIVYKITKLIITTL